MRSLAILALAAGCVSKAKYTELEASYDRAVVDRDAAEADAEKVRAELEEVRARNRKRLEAFAAVYEDLLEIQSAGLAKVRIEDGRAVLQLESDVLFASGSAELTPAGKETVEDIAEALAGSTAEFQVEGHTDGDAIDTKEFPSNWHLGADRAINVVLAMTAAGMPADRISAATFAQHAPVAPNDTAADKKLNRRIELVWMPEMSEVLPYRRMLKELEEKATTN